MEHYLLIESRDPFESNDVPYYYELSKDLVEAGNDVTLYLVQNGVLATRASAHSGLSSLAETGVKVLADDVAASIETVVDLLAAGHKTLWH
jgi:hypothetical protein